jgi:hypothetical protein
MRSGLDDAERVALVGMSRIPVRAYVRAKQIDASKPVKPPIAQRHKRLWASTEGRRPARQGRNNATDQQYHFCS